MKNLILFLIAALILWSCDSDSEPNQEFSVKGKLVENCETGKPLSNVNLVLVCKDIWRNKADIVIPFKTNVDGSFDIKGESNYSYYYIRYGSYDDLTGLTILDGMGPKNYDVGTIISEFKEDQYYPVIVKYDLAGSTFQTGDSIIFETILNRISKPVKNSISQFSENDTIWLKGWLIDTNFPDGNYMQEARANSGSPLNLDNFGFVFQYKKVGQPIKLMSPGYSVLYTCDKYPVVTVKIP